jgi:hypothetical protein
VDPYGRLKAGRVIVMVGKVIVMAEKVVIMAGRVIVMAGRVFSHTDYYLYEHVSSFSFDSISENSRKDINFITKRARGGLRIPTVIYMDTFLASPSTLFPPF